MPHLANGRHGSSPHKHNLLSTLFFVSLLERHLGITVIDSSFDHSSLTDEECAIFSQIVISTLSQEIGQDLSFINGESVSNCDINAQLDLLKVFASLYSPRFEISDQHAFTSVGGKSYYGETVHERYNSFNGLQEPYNHQHERVEKLHQYPTKAWPQEDIPIFHNSLPTTEFTSPRNGIHWEQDRSHRQQLQQGYHHQHIPRGGGDYQYNPRGGGDNQYSRPQPQPQLERSQAFDGEQWQLEMSQAFDGEQYQDHIQQYQKLRRGTGVQSSLHPQRSHDRLQQRHQHQQQQQQVVPFGSPRDGSLATSLVKKEEVLCSKCSKYSRDLTIPAGHRNATTQTKSPAPPREEEEKKTDETAKRNDCNGHGNGNGNGNNEDNDNDALSLREARLAYLQNAGLDSTAERLVLNAEIDIRRFDFSWLTLEFKDPFVQKRYVQSLALEASFWSSLVGMVLPTLYVNSFYMLGDTVTLARTPGSNDASLRAGFAISIFTLHVIFAVMYLRDVYQHRDALRTVVLTNHQRDLMIDDDEEARQGGLCTDNMDDEEERANDEIERRNVAGHIVDAAATTASAVRGRMGATITSFSQLSTQGRLAGPGSQSRFRRLIVRTMNHSYAFVFITVFMLGYAVLSRTTYDSCDASAIPDSLCVVSVRVLSRAIVALSLCCFVPLSLCRFVAMPHGVTVS